MLKIEDQVSDSDSGYTTWGVLDTTRESPLICSCNTKSDAELILESLTVLDELNKGYYF